MENLFEDQIRPLALEKLKRAVMPDSPESVRKMTEVFLTEIKNRRYSQTAKGEIVVLDAEGNMVENRHGWALTGQDVIEETFDKFFTDNGLPHTVDEAYRRLRNPNITTEERIKLTNWINGR